MRLPSVSYWPPWHGQPKPAGCTGVSYRTTFPCLSLTSFFWFVSTGPFGCTGQPRCAQWFERIVKLGSSPRKPLLRM